MRNSYTQERIVDVWGHITLQNLSLTERLGYEPESRDSGNRTKHFEANYIPFELKFRLPKLRKGRIIFERDVMGRIIHSKPPAYDIELVD